MKCLVPTAAPTKAPTPPPTPSPTAAPVTPAPILPDVTSPPTSLPTKAPTPPPTPAPTCIQTNDFCTTEDDDCCEDGAICTAVNVGSGGNGPQLKCLVPTAAPTRAPTPVPTPVPMAAPVEPDVTTPPQCNDPDGTYVILDNSEPTLDDFDFGQVASSSGLPGYKFEFDNDQCNLNLIDPDGNAIWSTDTSGNVNGCYAELDNKRTFRVKNTEH